MNDSRVRGVGIGLRWELAEALFREQPPSVKWLEIHPENYIGRAGFYEAQLEEARARYPIVTHGLTMCLGTPERPDPGYVRDVRNLLRALGCTWHSEHLCWGGTGAFLHDLLPMPQTMQAAERAAARLRELRDALEIDLALENASTYGHPGPRDMDEIDFVLEVLDRSDGKMLLDVNNVWVNQNNHGIDARAYIDRIPPERVVQIHVAGHFVRPDGLIIDTHAEPVRAEVRELLAHTLRRMPDVPVLLERDGNYPPFEELMGEVSDLTAIVEAAR
ncbi:MAG: DUF692 domain-containing protein [Sandaracinus sp.]